MQGISMFFPVGDPDFYALLFIFINILFVLFYLFRINHTIFSALIFMGFLLRVVLMFADYYHWFPILNSGADTERFNRLALKNAYDPGFEIGGYVGFLRIIYTLTDASRLIAQYVNVLFGLGLIIVVYKTLILLDISHKLTQNVLLIVIFLPNLIIFSGILLREAWVEFFVAASVFYFLKWYKNGGYWHQIAVIGCVLAGAYMHSGVIGLLVGYIVAFLSYTPSSGKLSFSGSTIASLIVLGGLLIVFMSYGDLFTKKFADYDFESEEDFLNKVNKSIGGGSDYLTWINTNSVFQGFLFAPLKMFYFLFSPLPTEWRGANDIIGFLIDGALYLYLCVQIFRAKITNQVQERFLKRYLIAALALTTFVFAYGTSNAGTAFRHRAKIVSLIIVTYAISVNFSNKNKNNYIVDDTSTSGFCTDG
ncbi:MAG: hypothetical protein LBL90_10455 [Prevotellaceae bacterium]|nr:hypothetical protein [Prevotellaceae bacterium]